MPWTTARGLIRSCGPAATPSKQEHPKSRETLWATLFWACPRAIKDNRNAIRIDGNSTDAEKYGPQIPRRGVSAGRGSQADGNRDGVRCGLMAQDRRARLDRHYLSRRIWRLRHGHGGNGGHAGRDGPGVA